MAASNAPTPGGGSVSAAVGALAASMASMAGNFTVGKEKFREVETAVRGCLDRLAGHMETLLTLMEKDSEEYAKVTAAYKLPRGTDDEKAARKAAVQDALRAATAVPRDGVRASLAVAREAAVLIDIANPMLASDVGVAAVLAAAALEGCRLNVEINLAYLDDAALRQELQQELDAARQEAERIKGAVLGKLRK
jgi:formiminotetrahydrofolate cyclodeaminase